MLIYKYYFSNKIVYDMIDLGLKSLKDLFQIVQQKADEYSNLVNWAKDNGAYINKVKIEYKGIYNRYVVASEDMKVNKLN